MVVGVISIFGLGCADCCQGPQFSLKKIDKNKKRFRITIVCFVSYSIQSKSAATVNGYRNIRIVHIFTLFPFVTYPRKYVQCENIFYPAI